MRARHSVASVTARLTRFPGSRGIAAALCTALLAISVLGTAQAQTTPGMMNITRHRLLVEPRAGLPEAELDKLLSVYGAHRTSYLKALNVYIVQLPAQADEVGVGQALTRSPMIKFVEGDRALEPAQAANQPGVAPEWHLAKINAPVAWNAASGAGITIAVLDSGVDTRHPDLSANTVPGWNFFDGSTNTADVSGHGTQLAGIAAAAGSNKSGVMGIDRRAKVMALRVTDNSGLAYDSLIAQALVWAADHGARVANVGFVGAGRSLTVLNAARYMRSKGGIVVVSAAAEGPERKDAQAGLVTTVVATDSADARANAGSAVGDISVAAPGVSIRTTMPGGGYTGASGNGAAAAIVSGVYALMMSANARLDPLGLDKALFEGAAHQGAAHRDPYIGWGRIDAAETVAKAQHIVSDDRKAPTTVVGIAAGANMDKIIAVNASAADESGIARVELYANDVLVAADADAPYAFALDTRTLPVGTTILYTRAYDTFGNAANSASVPLPVTGPAVSTDTPTIRFATPHHGDRLSGPVPIEVSASDRERITRLSLTINGREVAVSQSNSLSFVWDTVRATQTPASYTITARAWDPAGNTSAATISVIR